MRRASLGLLAFIGTVFADGPKPVFESRFVQREGAYFARVEGTMDLPDGARLEGDLYYVRKIDPKAFVPPLDVDEEEFPIASRSEPVTGGAFAFHLGPFPRAPYPGRYRMRVEFDPQIQSREVFERLPGGGQRAVVEKDFDVGSLDELPAMLDAVREEIRADFLKLDPIHDDLLHRFLAAATSASPTAAGSGAWAGDVPARLEELEGRNELRLDARISELEPRGKFFLQGLCVRLQEIVAACTASLEGRDPQAKLKAHRLSDDFRDRYNEFLDDLGFDRPSNPERVLPHLARVRAAAESVEAAEGAAGTERTARRQSADVEVHAAVFALLTEAPARAVQPLSRLAADWKAFLEAAPEGRREARGKIRDDLEAVKRAFGIP